MYVQVSRKSPLEPFKSPWWLLRLRTSEKQFMLIDAPGSLYELAWRSTSLVLYIVDGSASYS